VNQSDVFRMTSYLQSEVSVGVSAKHLNTFPYTGSANAWASWARGRTGCRKQFGIVIGDNEVGGRQGGSNRGQSVLTGSDGRGDE
jgi:hypothetical protein